MNKIGEAGKEKNVENRMREKGDRLIFNGN
jgi:hypothetical protein